MKQQSFFKASTKEHGGILAQGKRRSLRPLSTKHPLHLTLRSDCAQGQHSLLRHRPRIERILKSSAARFNIRVYESAICGNHLHLVLRGKRRIDLQNFFRVFAGHLAQEILREFPLRPGERPSGGGALEPQSEHPGQRQPGGASTPQSKMKKRPAHPKNQRKFWALLTYTRVLTWGREYKRVVQYLIQNTLEALRIVAYSPRNQRNPRNRRRPREANG